MSRSIEHKLSLPGREELELNLEVSDEDEIIFSQLKGVGGPHLLRLLTNWRPKFTGFLMDLDFPKGNDPASILLRELIMKAKGEWMFPFEEDELCHCRAIPKNKVDMAIITGAHTPEEVSEQTSASTACGTCRPDVEAIIEFRLFRDK